MASRIPSRSYSLGRSGFRLLAATRPSKSVSSLRSALSSPALVLEGVGSSLCTPTPGPTKESRVATIHSLWEMTMQPAVSCGIDIGHSGVKIVSRVRKLDGGVFTNRQFFPTAVMEAFEIRDQVEQQNARRDTVKVGSRHYFVGETAALHGDPESFLDDGWVSRPEHSALLRVAANRVEEVVGQAFGRRVMVLGLPARLEALQRDVLGSLASDLCPSWDILIVPQSKAPFYAYLFDDKGRMDSGGRIMQQGWGVIDVGRYTTDCAAISQGRWSESSFSSDAGTKCAEDHLIWLVQRQGHVLAQADAEIALRTGSTLRNTVEVNLGEEVDEALSLLRRRVLDYARRNFSKAGAKLNGIILAGGGASLVEESIRSVWENVVALPDARYAIADGMSKFGLAADAGRSVSQVRPVPVAA